MDVGDLFRDFQYDDLQWVVPVLAGLLIIVGALLAGIIRGMSAGVIIAIFFGGLMAMAPTLVTLVQPRNDRLAEVTSSTARSAAELAEVNNEVVTDLVRAMTTLRRAVSDLRPVVRAANGEGDQLGTGGFEQSLTDAESRLDEAIDTLSTSANVRSRLADDMQALEVERRRLDLEARRAMQ